MTLYNITSITNAVDSNGLFGLFQSLNAMSGQLFFCMILAVFDIILLVNFIYFGMENAFAAVTFISLLVAFFLFLAGLIPALFLIGNVLLAALALFMVLNK